MAKGLEDTRVIVTGAAGGIGRATAEVFLAAGSRVVLADIDESRLEAPEEELRALGTVLASACDVTRLADVKRLVEFTAKEFGFKRPRLSPRPSRGSAARRGSGPRAAACFGTAIA